MHVVVGPVSAQSAVAWLSYARQVVDELERLAHGERFATPEVRVIFDGYLTEWELIADKGEVFLWETDIPAERVEYHVHAFHQVVILLAEREQETGKPHAPPESEDFYTALLTGVLTALRAESAASAEFAQHLSRFWPGHEELLS